MRCINCDIEILSGRGSDEFTTYCYPCYVKISECDVCGSMTMHLAMINKKSVCKVCYDKIDNIINNPRIIDLTYDSFPDVNNMKENLTFPQSNNDFETLGGEALSVALEEKNYEIIGVSPHASLDEVKRKCKELLKKWHPDLHKNDPDKHTLAVQKFKELKRAYEAIVNELEQPYKLLELKYGDSQKSVMRAFQSLREIYNPAYFSENPDLCDKVKYKRNEITKAYEHLMMVMQKGSKPALSSTPLAASFQKPPLQQVKPLQTTSKTPAYRQNVSSVVSASFKPENIKSQNIKDNSARKTKGIKWAFNVFYVLAGSCVFVLVMKLLFTSAGQTKPQEEIIGTIVGFVGMMIIACPIAYSIGYFTEKAD